MQSCLQRRHHFPTYWQICKYPVYNPNTSTHIFRRLCVSTTPGPLRSEWMTRSCSPVPTLETIPITAARNLTQSSKESGSVMKIVLLTGVICKFTTEWIHYVDKKFYVHFFGLLYWIPDNWPICVWCRYPEDTKCYIVCDDLEDSPRAIDTVYSADISDSAG